MTKSGQESCWTKVCTPRGSGFRHELSWLAHIIREPSKSIAKSVCALQAERRWVVSGTPIQNRLTDLFSLFKFLRCSPFDDLNVFHSHVTESWKARSDPSSVIKLKSLVNCISLRRPKTTVELLPRTDEIVHLHFNEHEARYYEFIKSTTLRKIKLGMQESTAENFINTLKWLNELRLVCNHGTTNAKTIEALEESPVVQPAWSEQEVQTCFDELDQLGLSRCSNPNCCRDLSSALSSELDEEEADESRLEKSLEHLCSSCSHVRGGRVNKSSQDRNDLSRCSTGLAIPGIGNGYVQQGLLATGCHKSRSNVEVPTKIQRVVQDLSETPEGIKRFA